MSGLNLACCCVPWAAVHAQADNLTVLEYFTTRFRQPSSIYSLVEVALNYARILLQVRADSICCTHATRACGVRVPSILCLLFSACCWCTRLPVQAELRQEG